MQIFMIEVNLALSQIFFFAKNSVHLQHVGMRAATNQAGNSQTWCYICGRMVV